MQLATARSCVSDRLCVELVSCCTCGDGRATPDHMLYPQQQKPHLARISRTSNWCSDPTSALAGAGFTLLCFIMFKLIILYPAALLCCLAHQSSAGNSTSSCTVFRTVTSDTGPVEPFIHPEVSDTDYGIPHIKEKLPIGIALSGGGFRAATCAVGFMRGLHKVSRCCGEPRQGGHCLGQALLGLAQPIIGRTSTGGLHSVLLAWPMT